MRTECITVCIILLMQYHMHCLMHKRLDVKRQNCNETHDI